MRVRVRARVMEWNFSLFLAVKVGEKNFVVARCNNCTKVNMGNNLKIVIMS